MNKNFTFVDRSCGCCWAHKTKPMWITCFPSVPGIHAEVYHAYKAIERIRPGHQVWTADNRAIGGRDGYPTFEAAAAAVEEA